MGEIPPFHSFHPLMGKNYRISPPSLMYLNHFVMQKITWTIGHSLLLFEEKKYFPVFFCIKTGGCCDTVRVVAPTSDPAALAEDISGVYRLNDSMSGKDLN